jgi:hypothetical protein
MRSFDQFLAMLNEIPDPRRAEGKLALWAGSADLVGGRHLAL